MDSTERVSRTPQEAFAVAAEIVIEQSDGQPEKVFRALHRAASKLRDKSKEALAYDGWRPIETAPCGQAQPYQGTHEDAPYVLYDNGLHIGVGYCLDKRPEGGPVEWYDECGEPIEPQPVFWMPLPARREAS